MEMKHNHKKTVLIAFLALISSGCTILLNTQANYYAEQAEQAARNCPAAAEKAAEARQAANMAANMTDKITALQAMGDRIMQLEAQRNKLWDQATQRGYFETNPGTRTAEERDQALETADHFFSQAALCKNMDPSCDGCTDPASCEARAQYAQNSGLAAEERAGLLGESYIEQNIYLNNQMANACSKNAKLWEQWGPRILTSADEPAGLEKCTVAVYDSSSDEFSYHECRGVVECQARAQEFHDAAASNETARDPARELIREQLRQNKNESELLNDAFSVAKKELLDALQAAGIQDVPNFENSSSLPVAQVQQWLEAMATQSQNALNEVQRIAAEQCGEGIALKDAPVAPSPPSGEYPQDIYGSQQMGLPTAGPAPLVCPASCAGTTQAWCTFTCSVPVGPCALCPVCAAQGCP